MVEVIKNGSVPEDDATNAPLFYGGPVSRQPLVAGGKSQNFNFSLVNFYDGAKKQVPLPHLGPDTVCHQG